MDQMFQIMQRDLLKRAPVPELTTINGVVKSVVYVTAQPTFTGVIGGLTTLNPDDSDTPSTRINSQSQNTALTTSQSRPIPVSRSSSSFLNPTASATFAGTTASTALASFTYGQGQSTQTATFGNGASGSSSASSDSSSGGMSLGAKIGLAVGIICGIGVIASLILLLLARKRRQMKRQAQTENEKKSPSVQPAAPAQPGATQSPIAPRLSLRPVSRLVPEFIGGAQQKNRSSQGNTLAPISEANNNRGRNASPSHELVERVKPSPDRSRPAENPFQDPENPFVDPEKALRTPQSNGTSPINAMAPQAAIPNHMTKNEMASDQRVSGPTAESFPIPQMQGHAHVPAPGSGSGPGPTPRSAPAPAPLSVPVVTTHYELPAAPSPVVAPGPGPGPEASPQSNVYRILMDFRPTMEDELELRAGQLVRMLHEYDDGWALCIRLDRSQQGVVPRTCLAAKPSKPRPGPPPSGPASRPMTPQGRPRGTTPVQGAPAPVNNPAHVRAQSPAIVNENTGAFNQPPRPLSPGPRPQPQVQPQSQIQTRSMSPGPYGAGGPQPMAPVDQRRRSNSVGASGVRDMRNSPPGPSRLGPGPPPARSTSPGLAM